MKHKSTKRPILTKYQQQRRSSNTSTTIIDATAISNKKVDLGTGTAHLDSHTICLKTSSILKSQKALKRDLLRCSDQRPSLLGPQTLQPPRIHHGSQRTPSSSTDQHPTRRRSLSLNSRTFYATIDRIGPWPDISISRLRSDGNELLRPLKNFRNLKNPRVFSPKYYAGLSENTSKFKFYSSTRNYIDEYRKQKGYLLGGTRTKPQIASLALSASVQRQQSEDDENTAVGEFSGGGADLNNGTAGDRAIQSTSDLSVLPNGSTRSTHDLNEHINTIPSIPSVSKLFHDSHHMNSFPTITMRNGHLRPTRHPPHHAQVAQQTQHQQAIALPSLTASSLHYISSMSSVEKAYSNSKKPPVPNHSKLFLIDGRHKKRLAHRIHSDSEMSSRSQDYSELRATGGPVVTTTQRTTAVVVYQLPRRPPPLPVNQSDVESLG